MYRCDLCNIIVQKRNKTKHNQTKKQKCYSNLILNRYVIKNVKLIKFKDVFIPYSKRHTGKFNFFTVSIFLRIYDGEHPLNHKINVSNYVIYNNQSEHYTTYTTQLANYILHRVISIYFSHRGSPKIIPEIEIVFISDPKDITGEHYLEQPKSMLCRKLIRGFHESTSQDFEYKWLPDSFKDLRVCFTF